MDFIEFLNSKDVAEYLRKINYKFTPEEALYVIHESRTCTLAQKREAYTQLLAQFPDYKLMERGFGAFKNHTLASFLDTYFKKQDALIDECKRAGDAAYSFCTYTSAEGWIRDDGSLFRTFGECLLAAGDDEEVEKIEIVKKYLSSDRFVSLTLRRDGTILDVGSSERDDEVMDAFEMLYVEIPTPFRFGDIVKPVREKVWDSEFHEQYEDVCVLTYLPQWDEKAAADCDPRETRMSAENYAEAVRQRERRLKEGDETDMLYAGYSVTEHGFVCDHSVWGTYLDLEYFREEPAGRCRILTAISLYLKKKMNLETLFAAVRAIEAEETKRELWECSLQGYEEYMKQVKIEEEKP